MSSRSVSVAKLSAVAAVAALAGALTAYVPMREAGAENQPRMRSALQSLQNARAHLNQATGDKGGHRVAALRLVDSAIDEVQKGIAVDNRR